MHKVIHALLIWGATWAFGDPNVEQLDPLLLMWWMHNRANFEQLPAERTAIQFDFYGARTDTYRLVLTPDNVDLCALRSALPIQTDHV